MRQQIDCAVLRLAVHHPWIEEVLYGASPAMTRVRLHQLEWEAGENLAVDTTNPVTLPVQALAQASVSLRRFDLCLLPVSVDTLAWTRQALALIPRGPFLPLVGVFQNLKSAAMQDLLELGMSDFVRLPLCNEEFRARVLSTVARVPRASILREPEVTYAASEYSGGVFDGDLKLPQSLYRKTEPGKVPEPILKENTHSFLKTKALKARTSREKELQLLQGAIAFNARHHKAEPVRSFRDAKNELISNFERSYITQALTKHSGNIAMAARASNKHRRAFWALMRKHDIAAEPYRVSDGEE
jgi:hypothetical protein